MFSWKYCEISKFIRTAFLQNSPVAASAFFKKQLTVISQRCERQQTFRETHRLMYKKLNLFVYKFAVNCQVF